MARSPLAVIARTLRSFPVTTPALGWGIGWGIASASIVATGGSIGWQEGGLVLGSIEAFLGWAVGAASSIAALTRRTAPGDAPELTHRRIAGMALGWTIAFAAAAGLTAPLVRFFESATIGYVSSAGFLGLILAAGAGGAIGGLVTGVALYGGGGSTRARSVPPILSGAWAIAFAVSIYPAIVAGMALGEILKVLLSTELLGWRPGLALGWGLGATLAGLVAGALGGGVTARVYRSG